jgi:hypothetical protein
MLTNRAQRVLKNTDGESNRTLGLVISSVPKDWVVGSASSSNLDGTGEADCCLAIVGTAVTVESMGAPGERSGRRGWGLQRRKLIWTDLSPRPHQPIKRTVGRRSGGVYI